MTWQARVAAVLARALAVMVGWVVLMGVPVLYFHGDLGPRDLGRFLGFFYALLLVVATVIAREVGTPSLVLLSLPFLLLFTGLGGRVLLWPGAGGDRLGSLGYLAVWGVVALAWLLGNAFRSPEPKQDRFM